MQRADNRDQLQSKCNANDKNGARRAGAGRFSLARQCASFGPFTLHTPFFFFGLPPTVARSTHGCKLHSRIKSEGVGGVCASVCAYVALPASVCVCATCNIIRVCGPPKRTGRVCCCCCCVLLVVLVLLLVDDLDACAAC